MTHISSTMVVNAVAANIYKNIKITPPHLIKNIKYRYKYIALYRPTTCIIPQ